MPAHRDRLRQRGRCRRMAPSPSTARRSIRCALVIWRQRRIQVYRAQPDLLAVQRTALAPRLANLRLRLCRPERQFLAEQARLVPFIPRFVACGTHQTGQQPVCPQVLSADAPLHWPAWRPAPWPLPPHPSRHALGATSVQPANARASSSFAKPHRRRELCLIGRRLRSSSSVARVRRALVLSSLQRAALVAQQLAVQRAHRHVQPPPPRLTIGQGPPSSACSARARVLRAGGRGGTAAPSAAARAAAWPARRVRRGAAAAP